MSLPFTVLAQNNTISAPSFDLWDKFDYTVVQTFGARGFVGAGIGAGFGQLLDSPKEWGQGVEGYAERYASSFGGNVSRQVMAFSLESTLHEDPRYFPSEEKGFKARMKNVLRQSVFTKTDSGGTSFAYARVGSAFGSAFLENTWQPASTDSAGHALLRGAISIGSDTAYNFLQEFLPFTRPRSLRHRH